MDEAAKNCPIGLCVLCGLPGAGKSTLARQLKSRHNPFSVVIISYDDVIADVAFQEDSLHEYRDVSCQQGGRECLEHLLIGLLTTSALKPPSGRIKGTWTRFVQCLESQGFISSGGDSEIICLDVMSSPVYFILDDNFYYRSMRYEVFQLARKYSLGFCQLYVDCPVDCCSLRNRTRPNPVMDKTIILMDTKLEKPNPEKNTWEKDSLYLAGSKSINMDEFGARIANLMNDALENPFLPTEDDSEEKERDREICAASIIHQADQNLRRLISETMQTAKGLVSAKDIKQIAQEVQQAKCKALDQLRRAITEKTEQASATESICRVESSFREDIDWILQEYLHNVQLDCPTVTNNVT